MMKGMNFSEYQSNESFPDDLESRNPEQATLHSLVDKITQLTNLDIAREPWGDNNGRLVLMYEVPATLAEAGHKKRGLTVTRFADPENINLLASITHTEQLGTVGDRLLTKYDMENSPDGIQIEKRVRSVNILTEGLFKFAPLDFMAVEAELERRAELERISHAEEDAIGMSFVSEAEVRELLRMLHDDFIPYSRKPN